MSDCTTRGIRIQVRPRYLPEASRPEAGQWMFGYDIEITNTGSETVQLLHRHWVITDGDGQTQEVRGAGVVGQQPVIAPGGRYQYNSGCPLTTPVGTMHGSYQMQVLDSQTTFDARIAPFRLAVPGVLN
jgi:ApaG protein